MFRSPEAWSAAGTRFSRVQIASVAWWMQAAAGKKNDDGLLVPSSQHRRIARGKEEEHVRQSFTSSAFRTPPLPPNTAFNDRGFRHPRHVASMHKA